MRRNQDYFAQTMREQSKLMALETTSPVQLAYEHHPSNIFPHWVVLQHGTYNHAYYEDMFRTKTPFSDRRQWLLENVGLGGDSAGRYVDQKWFVYETGYYAGSITAVCFLHETDALLFKMRWAI